MAFGEKECVDAILTYYIDKQSQDTPEVAWRCVVDRLVPRDAIEPLVPTWTSMRNCLTGGLVGGVQTLHM